jgi:hypothetical protein
MFYLHSVTIYINLAVSNNTKTFSHDHLNNYPRYPRGLFYRYRG